MAIELKTRSEIDPKFQWKLTDIFESVEAWEAEIAALTEKMPEIEALSGTLKQGADSLLKGLQKFYALSERVELAYIYAQLYMNADNGNTKAQAMKDRAMRLVMTFSTVSAFLVPEILEIPAETLKGYLADPRFET